MLALVLDSVQAEAGSLWLLRGDKIVCEHAHGGAGDKIIGLELPRGAGVVGSVADKRRPEIVLDAAADRRHVQQVDDATGFTTRSMMTVPLLHRGDCLGALQILNKRGDGGRFTPEDAEVVQEIAADAASVLRTAQLIKTESRAKEMRALLRMSREITSALDLDRLLLTAANILSGIVAFDRCSIALEREGALRVAAVSGKEKPDPEDPGVRAVGELLTWVRGFEATIYSPSPDALEESDPEKATRFRAHAEATKMQSVLVIPLKDESGFIGLLSMEAAGEDFMEEGQQELVEIYANLVAVSLRNAELYRQTPLSGLLGAGRAGAGAAVTGLWRTRRGRTIGIAAGVLLALGLVPVDRGAGGEAEVVPFRRHHLRAEVALVVDRIDVEEGQAVKAGQALGALKTAELEVTRADLEARLRTARADAVRYAGAGMAGEERAARDQEASLGAQLALVARRLDACALVSPVDGFVLTRRPRDLVGTVAPAGRTVLEVAEAGKWTVEVRVDQDAATGVATGQPASFATSAAPGASFEGKVVAVAPAADASSGTPLFPVSCEVEDTVGVLRPGMRGRGWVRFGGTLLGLRVLSGPVRWLRWKTGI